MRVVTVDGKVFDGATAGEIVSAMHRDAWVPEKTNNKYMREVARRATVQTGMRHCCDTAETLIADLVDSGLIALVR